MADRSARALLCVAACALLATCGPGPTVYLGSLAVADGGGKDAGGGDRDGDGEGRGDGDDDDDDIPCSDDQVCGDTREPYCHPRREVCVECLRDEHCPAGEHCEDDGDCDN